jgi:hypothetical protein
MIAVIDAQLAWCPPTFSPSAFVDDLQRFDVGGDGLEHRPALAAQVAHEN